MKVTIKLLTMKDLGEIPAQVQVLPFNVENLFDCRWQQTFDDPTDDEADALYRIQRAVQRMKVALLMPNVAPNTTLCIRIHFEGRMNALQQPIAVVEKVDLDAVVADLVPRLTGIWAS